MLHGVVLSLHGVHLEWRPVIRELTAKPALRGKLAKKRVVAQPRRPRAPAWTPSRRLRTFGQCICGRRATSSRNSTDGAPSAAHGFLPAAARDFSLANLNPPAALLFPRWTRSARNIPWSRLFKWKMHEPTVGAVPAATLVSPGTADPHLHPLLLARRRWPRHLRHELDEAKFCASHFEPKNC